MSKRLSIGLLILMLIFSLFSTAGPVFAQEKVMDSSGIEITEANAEFNKEIAGKKFPIYKWLCIILGICKGDGDNGGEDGDENGEADLKLGSLTIHKYVIDQNTEDGVPGDGSENQEIPDGAKGLPGVEYKVEQTHVYNPDDDTWKEASDGHVAIVITGTDGKVAIEELPYGRYTVKEIGAPDYVVTNPNKIVVDIPMTNSDGTSTNDDVHIYPKNELIEGSVKLIKKDGDQFKKKLKGVTFDLYKKVKKGKDKKVKSNLTTNNHGIIKVDGLEYGNYYFVETDTVDGYLLNGEKQHFKIKKQGQTKNIKMKNYVKPEVKKKVDKKYANRGEEVEFTISVDLPGDIKNYKNFTVTDVLDNRFEFVEDSESSPHGFKFNKSGQKLTWDADPKKLSKGEAVFTFKAKISEKAKPGKVIRNQAKIKYNNKYQEGYDKSNKTKTTPTAGDIKVIKKDGDSGEKLKGAKFELQDKDGNVVATKTTNSNGVIKFKDVNYGEYELVEIKAPKGYNLLQNPVEIIVDKDNHDQTVTVDNYETGWNLPPTGGIGTTVFTIIGSILMATAIYLYFRRRKETA